MLSNVDTFFSVASAKLISITSAIWLPSLSTKLALKDPRSVARRGATSCWVWVRSMSSLFCRFDGGGATVAMARDCRGIWYLGSGTGMGWSAGRCSGPGAVAALLCLLPLAGQVWKILAVSACRIAAPRLRMQGLDPQLRIRPTGLQVTGWFPSSMHRRPSSTRLPSRHQELPTW